jgi:hypothetical protein
MIVENGDIIAARCTINSMERNSVTRTGLVNNYKHRHINSFQIQSPIQMYFYFEIFFNQTEYCIVYSSILRFS